MKAHKREPPYKGLVLSSVAGHTSASAYVPRSTLHPHTPGKNYEQRDSRNAIPRGTQAGFDKQAEQQG